MHYAIDLPDYLPGEEDGTIDQLVSAGFKSPTIHGQPKRGGTLRIIIESEKYIGQVRELVSHWLGGAGRAKVEFWDLTSQMTTSEQQWAADTVGQATLAEISKLAGRTFTSLDQVPPAIYFNYAKHLKRERDLYRETPNTDSLREELATIRAQQAGRLEAYVALELRAINIDRKLAPDGYLANPRYQGTIGEVNLLLQDFINHLSATYSPTDDRSGEYLANSDAGELLTSLINLLDGVLGPDDLADTFADFLEDGDED